MTAIIRNSFRVYNARKFIGSIDAVNGTYVNSLYLGIGRPQPWSILQGDTPTAPGNNIKDELTDWSDMMFMKRIFPSNICHAIPKRMWAANTFYDVYRHDWNGYSTSPANNNLASKIKIGGNTVTPTDLSKVKCYCISPNNKIYLCLVAAKDVAGNLVASTVNPETGTNTVPGTAFTSASGSNIVYCEDGYVWLELGNSVDLIAQFDTIDYYPVQLAAASSTGATQNQYSLQLSSENFKGGIYSIQVTAGGSNYLGGSAGSFKIGSPRTGEVTLGDGYAHVSVEGDGEGIEYVVQYKGGAVDNIIVTNPGQGYTWATVTFKNALLNGTTGAGAAATAVLSPLSGLGADPVKTLSAYYIIVQNIIYDDENVGDNAINHGTDFTVDNDYRKVTLVSNPLALAGTLATANKLDLTYALTQASGSNPAIPSDTILTYSGPTGDCKVRVVDSGLTSDATAKPIVRVIQTEFDKPSTGPNVNIVSGVAYVSSGYSFTPTVVVNPDALVGSGDVIYSDYRRPVTRAKQQSEEFKIILEF